MDHASKSRAFLIFCATGLTPIALGYGAAPATTMELVFGITVDTANLTHIFRAVMGLYLGMAGFWLIGGTRPALTGSALLACAVFMLGLAGGRVLSFVVDGLPHWLLIVYAALEVILGLLAAVLYRGWNQAETRRQST